MYAYMCIYNSNIYIYIFIYIYIYIHIYICISVCVVWVMPDANGEVGSVWYRTLQ